MINLSHKSMAGKVTMKLPRRRGRRVSKIITRALTMTDEESWDEDDQRRINENKNWKASDGPLAAWDIDKERDAVMYRKESLEAMLRLDYVPPEEITLLEEEADRLEEEADRLEEEIITSLSHIPFTKLRYNEDNEK
tara:strand:+ start:53 stop:463 length:411 start_codon:yes stop_codon:yes gene_type:complete